MIKEVSAEQAEAAAKAYKRHGGMRPAARALGIDRDTFRKRLHAAAERGMMPTEPVMPGYEIKRTTAEYDDAGAIKKEWVTQHKESGGQFELPAGHIYKGISSYVDQDGRIRAQWLKTKLDTVTPDLVAALEAAFKRYRGKSRPAPPPRATMIDLLTVYPIADQHNGLLAWGRETGEDYDLRIGVKRLRDSMAALVAQSKPSRQALILNLGDWQHTDDQRNMTPRSGNLLDVDSRYFKILSAGVDLMIDCIECAKRRHASIIVAGVPGNHDPHAFIALMMALKMFYANDKRVQVVFEPGEFFFHRFGAVLLGAHHGHRAKADKLAATMAAMRPADWGRTAFRYFYTGHIHHETAKEIGAVKVESFQTLAAKDAHAVGSAYLSGQSLTAITLHRRTGEAGRHRVNILPPRAA